MLSTIYAINFLLSFFLSLSLINILHTKHYRLDYNLTSYEIIFFNLLVNKHNVFLFDWLWVLFDQLLTHYISGFQRNGYGSKPLEKAPL